MKLAIQGGSPVRTQSFPAYRPIGDEEKVAVNRVMDSGVLSKFLGCWDPDFFGGPEVQALEKEWAAHFGVKHAISVNSNTSGLYCAIGAAGVEPGDEVIVSPYTMAASATAPLVFNAIPVFADIEEEFFCLDVNSIEEKITPRTRAIVIVDIFGLPYDVERVNALAKKHGLTVIEDAAQSPGAFHRGKHAGTLGDIGVFSLNYHKHIHCGEGGIVVTDDDRLADRVRLIRNHAEAVVESKGTVELDNMIGFNFRMTELEASIARCQLRKLDGLLKARQENCAYLSEQLAGIPALGLPKVRAGSTHAFYVHPIRFFQESAGMHRDRFVEAVRAELPHTELREAEGALVSSGYVKPLYLAPMFQKQIAYGTRGCPFKAPWYEGTVNYGKGLCPVTERMHYHELIEHELMRPPMTRKDLDDVAKAFWKVWENRNQLK
jgi:dTDP-4-amino-4,6-dideoxygalactose transaminase